MIGKLTIYLLTAADLPMKQSLYNPEKAEQGKFSQRSFDEIIAAAQAAVATD